MYRSVLFKDCFNRDITRWSSF